MDNVVANIEKLTTLSDVLNSDSHCPLVYAKFLDFIAIYEETRAELERRKQHLQELEQQLESCWSGNDRG